VDDTDRSLIRLLRDNARASVAALAKHLRVSRGTVQNRMARLEKDGVIVGYTVKLRAQVEEQRIRAWMLIAVEANRVEGILKELRGDPGVAELHTTNGRWDLVAELRADTLEHFDQMLRRIGLLEGITTTETNLLLSTYKL
jgi:DNA-binding Lrp family transcriptional regulator